MRSCDAAYSHICRRHSSLTRRVHECYRRNLAGKVFARGHTKTVKLRVVGPMLRFLKSEVKKGVLPNYQLEEAYLWFGEVYGLILFEILGFFLIGLF